MENIINTERLQLQPLSNGDSSFILELVNTQGWLTFIGDRKVHTNEDALAYINKINNLPATTYWVARLKEDGQPAGIVTLLKRDYLDNPDIGFAFLPGFAGKGYAYEATQAVMNYLGDKPGYQTLLATTIPANSRSIALLERLGFAFEKQMEVTGVVLQVYKKEG